MATPPTDSFAALQATLARVAAWDARAALQLVETPPSETDWISAARLCGPEQFRLGELITDYARQIGTSDRRIGASLFVKRYALAIVPGVVACYSALRQVPDPAADNIWLRFKDGTPVLAAIGAQHIKTPSASGASATELNRELMTWLQVRLFDAHLRLLIRAIRGHVRISDRVLWANVAVTCARAFSWCCYAHDLRDRALADAAVFFDAGQPIHGTGQLVYVRGAEVEGLAHERTVCCLKYLVPTLQRCAECNLLSPDERQRAMLDELAVVHAARGRTDTPIAGSDKPALRP